MECRLAAIFAADELGGRIEGEIIEVSGSGTSLLRCVAIYRNVGL